jgi:hypothetical protein
VQEIASFKDVRKVHDLPDIFHYWSHKFLLPKCEMLGIPGVEAFFAQHIAEYCAAHSDEICRVASLGAGNCDTEIAVAEQLLNRRITNFRLQCLDVNPHMLVRGREMARYRKVSDYHLAFIETDIKG